MQELIEDDYKKVEPYVDKVFRFISNNQLCIIILDNVDLYEDDDLETTVFAEGLSLSKRLTCNVIVSIRDTTFAKHQSDSTFNAYQLRKLWLDPPPFQAVLSKRLTYSKKILENRSGTLLVNNVHVNIADLSGFFDTVQRSVLQGATGHFIESMADLDIRKGLNLITNFLTSKHVEAERAVLSYMKGDGGYIFPFHEVFKGTMLGQWKHFREARAECINVFDARLGVEHLKLLRLLLLNELSYRARQENTLEVPISDCIKIFSKCGASENHVIACLNDLHRRGLVRNVTADDIELDSVIAITKSGGYQAKFLSRRFNYVEECMHDTAIGDGDTWRRLEGLTAEIEQQEGNKKQRLLNRKERIQSFLDYLLDLENQVILPVKHLSHLASIGQIRADVLREVDRAIKTTDRYGI